MASNSLTILPATSHQANRTGVIVTFNAITKQFVSSDTGVISFSSLSAGDIVTVAGSGSNDGTFTVVASTPTELTVLETVVNEAEGASVTIDHVGVYGEQYKADGYYGHTDGLHTVSYHLNGFIGTVAMQATLASDPSYADWFNVAGTSFTYASAENSNNGYNFTGNFVWVRVALTNYTLGAVDKILYIY